MKGIKRNGSVVNCMATDGMGNGDSHGLFAALKQGPDVLSATETCWQVRSRASASSRNGPMPRCRSGLVCRNIRQLLYQGRRSVVSRATPPVLGSGNSQSRYTRYLSPRAQRFVLLVFTYNNYHKYGILGLLNSFCSFISRATVNPQVPLSSFSQAQSIPIPIPILFSTFLFLMCTAPLR